MLTILHPYLIPSIKALNAGLQPFRNVNTGEIGLIIKGQKEMILAARMNCGFKFYVAPLKSSIGITPALITAFFDDYDEPLVVKTPLFKDDEITNDLREMLLYEHIDVYFFDEHNREWMSYRVKLDDGGSCLRDGTKLSLPEFSHSALMALHVGIEHWFSERTEEDDVRAISATFLDRLGVEELFIMDFNGGGYLGGEGFTHSTLVRNNPGVYQEQDIAASLCKVFDSKQVAIKELAPLV